jgi:predicted nucleic acid-binding Zn ribbon protein
MAFRQTVMERAGRILAKWKGSKHAVETAALAEAAWRVAVGPKIAAHTLGASLVRNHLVVEVEDEVWRRQLSAMRPFILRNLARELGAGVVETIELRLAQVRKGPARQQGPRAAVPRKPPVRDEADGIRDPVLRNVYQRMRRKSTA